jgi:hypothetical protein
MFVTGIPIPDTRLKCGSGIGIPEPLLHKNSNSCNVEEVKLITNFFDGQRPFLPIFASSSIPL